MNKIVLGIGVVAALLIAVVLFTDDHAMDSDVLDPTENVTTIAVIFNGQHDDDGWGTAHYDAFESLKDALNLRIIYKENVPADDRCKTVIRECVDQGAKIIFATSFGFGAPVCAIAPEYPNIFFYNCSGIEVRPNVATYMGRIYQTRYLSGIAAGLQSNTGHLGFVAAMPIYEVNRGINAFTLGVRSVNPKASVHVAWTNAWGDFEKEKSSARQLLDKYPIDVIAYQQDDEGVIQEAADRGIVAIGNNVDKSKRFPKTALTSIVWNWAIFYKKAILDVLEDNFEGRHNLMGARSGIIGLAPLAPFAKPGEAERIEKEKGRMIDGSWDVFHGPIFDNQGILRVPAGTSMSDSQLINAFDWYVEGVVIEEKRE